LLLTQLQQEAWGKEKAKKKEEKKKEKKKKLCLLSVILSALVR